MTANILSLFNRAASDEIYRQGHWRDKTIYALAKGHAERRPDGFALRDQTRRLTWRDLVDAVDSFAADLAFLAPLTGRFL